MSFMVQKPSKMIRPQVTETNVSGDRTVTILTVPASRYAIIRNVSCDTTGAGTFCIFDVLDASGNVREFNRVVSPAANSAPSWTGTLVLRAGEKIQVRWFGLAAATNTQNRALGEEYLGTL